MNGPDSPLTSSSWQRDVIDLELRAVSAVAAVAAVAAAVIARARARVSSWAVNMMAARTVKMSVENRSF